MKIFLFLCMLIVDAIGDLVQDDHDWKQFKNLFNKTYDANSESEKKEIFRVNKQFVREHNERYENKEVHYRLGLNQFSDMTVKEREDYVKCSHAFNKRSSNASPKSRKVKGGKSLPAEIDWRKLGAVTSVRQYVGCLSCYAFAAVEALEGRWQIKGHPLIPLSPQQIIECSSSFGNSGCRGGSVDSSFIYAISEGGIASEDDYPYQKGFVNDCQAENIHKSAVILNYEDVEECDEEALMEAVAEGPVAANINAQLQSFYFYSGGIYSDETCTAEKTTFAVTIVGYGEEELPYWIVKMGWGTNWGEKGYMRLRRGVNLCGIANYAHYPVVL